MANERKVCPLLAIAVMLLPVPGYDPLSVDGNEAPCRREKCAWWVDFGKKPHCAVAMHPDTEETPDGRS